MKVKTISCFSLLIALYYFALMSAAKAQVFADNFSSNHNYVTQGVAGTAWSGVSDGLVDPGTVSVWDANISAPATLTITNSGGYQVDGGDGPFLWKTVTGDFTNVVYANLAQINYNFAGLLVRDAVLTNNWIYVALFAEYGFEFDIRDTVNGASAETTYSGPSYVETDPATWRHWIKITRVAGVLTAFASADGVNWDQLYQSARTDLANSVQAGVFDSTYSANVCSAQFKSFSITGPGVDAVAPPTQATSLTLNPGINNFQASWTPGAGSAGSVVVVRAALPITRQPLDGITYTGNTTLGNGDTLGESNYVVYVGAATGITVTNIIPYTAYTVAVYAYSGSGASTVYALTNTPVATVVPNGTPVGIAISYGATNAVAVDDSIQAQVSLNFDNGSSIDITGTATYSSANTNAALVNAAGLVSGLSAGTVAITAQYQTFSTSSNLTVVKLPVTDDFSVAHDYLTQGIADSYWSGLLLGTNDVDTSVGEVAEGPTTTLVADAGITQAGRLTVGTHDSGFASGADSGFFLYRHVSGDFSMAVQIASFDSSNATNAYHMPGIMVRAPFTFNYAEEFMQWVSFNEYSIGNFSRRMLGGAYAEVFQQPVPAEPFIMIQRQTNTFSFYQKVHALDPWTLVASEDHPELAGVVLQVGLVDQTFTANVAFTKFANLVLTTPGGITNSVNAAAAPTGLTLSSASIGQVSARWTPGVGSSGSIVIARPFSPITRQPSDGDDYSLTASNDITMGQNLGASNVVVYAGSGNSVLVSNLPIASVYFSVYSYNSVNGTNYYNTSGAPLANIVTFGLPAITAEPPAAFTRYVGERISIPVGASPGSYQWQANGTNLVDGARVSGSATTVLTINDLAISDAGNYTFINTNPAGSITSAPPTVVTVLEPTNSSELSVLADGPCAFWRLNETAGTIAYDYAGGFNGIYDPTCVLGVAGPRPVNGFPIFEAGNTAVQFDGNASVVTFPALTPPSESVSNLTISAWINPSAYPADREGIVSFNAPANTALRLYGGTTGLSILYNNTVTPTLMVPPLNQWSYVAMVITPNGATFYLATNGGWQVYSDAIARGPISLNETGYIGSDRVISGRYYAGVIDEVSIFKSALSGSAITNLFNGIAAPPVVTLNLQRTPTGVQLSWPQGTLLQATNLFGPWTPSPATSPFSVTNPVGTQFFRVKVQ